LSKEWAADTARRAAAGVPTDATFRTKPELARALLARAFAAGVPAAWVTGDEVYGRDRRLRVWLEQQEWPFVLAIKAAEPLWQDGPHYVPAEAIAATLPAERWHRLSAGAGTKGPRRYDWAWREVWRLPLPAAERAWAAWRTPSWRSCVPRRHKRGRQCRLLWAQSPRWEWVLTWSRWRRRHQRRAQHCHYRHRGAILNGEVRL
jgi:SRSO17 transposase